MRETLFTTHCGRDGRCVSPSFPPGPKLSSLPVSPDCPTCSRIRLDVTSGALFFPRAVPSPAAPPQCPGPALPTHHRLLVGFSVQPYVFGPHPQLSGIEEASLAVSLFSLALLKSEERLFFRACRLLNALARSPRFFFNSP